MTFLWVMTFFYLNQSVLDLYSSCTTAQQLVKKQNEWLELQQQSQQQQQQQHPIDGSPPLEEHWLPPDGSNEEEYNSQYDSEGEEPKLDKFGNYIIENDGKDVTEETSHAISQEEEEILSHECY
jgi:hypothetical protein